MSSISNFVAGDYTLCQNIACRAAIHKKEIRCENCGFYQEKPTNSNYKPTNPKDRAATSRLDLTVFPDTAVAYGALALTEGDLKYGAYNFRVAGVLASIYVAALNRHVAKWFNGEDEDPKTGVPHLANAIACLGVLIDAIVAGKLKDDRPPKSDVAGLLASFEEKVKHLQELFPNPPGRYTNDKSQAS